VDENRLERSAHRIAEGRNSLHEDVGVHVLRQEPHGSITQQDVNPTRMEAEQPAGVDVAAVEQARTS
jgi:hypothetical protein